MAISKKVVTKKATTGTTKGAEATKAVTKKVETKTVAKKADDKKAETKTVKKAEDKKPEVKTATKKAETKATTKKAEDKKPVAKTATKKAETPKTTAKAKSVEIVQMDGGRKTNPDSFAIKRGGQATQEAFLDRFFKNITQSPDAKNPSDITFAVNKRHCKEILRVYGLTLREVLEDASYTDTTAGVRYKRKMIKTRIITSKLPHVDNTNQILTVLHPEIKVRELVLPEEEYKFEGTLSKDGKTFKTVDGKTINIEKLEKEMEAKYGKAEETTTKKPKVEKVVDEVEEDEIDEVIEDEVEETEEIDEVIEDEVSDEEDDEVEVEEDEEEEEEVEEEIDEDDDDEDLDLEALLNE